MHDDPMASAITSISSRSDRNVPEFARTLNRIASQAPATGGVWSRDLVPGDWVVARTRNSVYVAAAIGDGSYTMTGGWFSGSRANTRVRIAGCTWGGSAIHTGLVAAPGMFLEFANGVRTTRIQDVRLIRNVAGREH